MINSRLLSLIRKEFIQILRDPRIVAMIIVIPVVQLFLLGYSASSDVRNVPLVVYDQDRSVASRELLDAYRAADYFSLAYVVNTEDELRELIEFGKAGVGIIIPPDYSENIEGSGQAHIAFVLDGSDPSVASTALSASQLIGQAYSTEVQFERFSKLGFTPTQGPPLVVHTQVWYNPDLEDAFFMVPGIIGMILFQS